jgi:hopanoid biosynthesis associated RND transporter like protein HpnN
MVREREKAGESGPLAHFLAAVTEAVCRRPRLTLLLAGILCTLSLFAAFTWLTYHTQRNDLISSDKEHLKRWRQYLAEFGDDDDMVVVVRGEDRQKIRHAIDSLAADIASHPEHFDRLFWKADLRALRDRALLYLPIDQLRRIREGVNGLHLLLEPPVLAGLDPLFGWKSLTILQLLHEADRRAMSLRTGRPLQAGDAQFFRQLDSICRSATRFLEDSGAYRNPWRSILPVAPDEPDRLAEPQYFFSGDSTLAFLLCRPVKETDSFTAAQKSIDALRSIVAAARPGFPELEIGLTGLPVLENDEMLASQSDTQTASWLALVGVGLLYLVVYRGLRFPLMTVTTLLVGTVWALGWLTVTVGHLNILSSAFAVMLIGMGDYGILWVTRYGQERRAGADLFAAMRQTAVSVGPSIVTAAVTTALAFYAALLADFKAVAELGWIAGSGVLLCAVACFTVMPALLCVFDRRLTRADRHGASEPVILSLAEQKADRQRWLPWLSRRPGLVIGVALAATAFFAICATRASYDHNLLHLQARGLESVQWEERLIAHTAGASWHALSYTTTPEEALALKARYEKLPGVSHVAEVASLVPRDQERKLELLQDIQYRLRRLPERGGSIPHATPLPADLNRTLSRLIDDLPGLESAGAVLPPLCEALGLLKARISALEPLEAAQRLQAFEETMTRDLAEDLHRLRDVSTPVPITVDDLPVSLRERFIGNSGKWLLRVFARDSLWDYQRLQDFVEQARTVDPEACGKPFSTLEGLRAMKEGFLWAAAYALTAIVIVLLLDFRSIKHTLLALAPLLMGLIAALGILTLLGVPLNPANMIALPLILGVGADNGVHVLHDYRSRAGGGQRYSLGHATGRGILVAALTTVLGFGTLMIARHQGLFGLGLMLTLGVSCCMLTALVFLPALLGMLNTREKQIGAAEKSRRRIAA